MGMPDGADLAATARQMVADGKGILAADESSGTIARRFAEIGVESTEPLRRNYRTTLFGAAGLADHVSGVILYEETLRQRMDDGTPVPAHLAAAGIIPGIKVDRGLVALRPDSKEQVTEGVDGLGKRLEEYRGLGARFAKWRAVFTIGAGTPSLACVRDNAWLLARYARICQDAGLVPIVEPEVLMDGDHPLDRSQAATETVLAAVFAELRCQGVDLEGMVLKPNMVTPGAKVFRSASVADVARATVRVLRACVPAAVPGIAFLSGGQSEQEATDNLAAIAALGPHPWWITFSFGRALQASALRAWAGKAENAAQAQHALLERAAANSGVLRAALATR
jgi:fructose-bisphosphate aldolase class I